MFIRPLYRYNRTTKEPYTLYSLCESYRSFGTIRHRTIIGLGKLEELDTLEEKKLLGARIEEMIRGGGNILPIGSMNEKLEGLARNFYSRIKTERRCDVNGEWETVNMKTIKNKDARDIGAEWLCKQAFDQLGLGEFLKGQGWSDEAISLAATHIICRAVYPASELRTVSLIKDNSAICEITNYNRDKITKDNLYGISHRLFSIKPQLENYLSRKTNELFDLEDKIILYDLTNTYYEGRMQESDIAKFGRSKEKRNDAKIVVLAVVVNREGFLKYSNIFEGNTSDCTTLETMIDTLSAKTSFTKRKPIVVMDAGIATEDNIRFLRGKRYNYMCVSRSNMKNYLADVNCTPVKIMDNREQPIELLKVRVDGDNDHYLWVKSQAKALKENGMDGLLSQRFEDGIKQINLGINTKGGTKRLEKVHERIGRLKQKYPSVHKYYDITVTDNGNGQAKQVSCKRKTGDDGDNHAGIYFLRTSLDEKDERTLWEIYNVIRNVESVFRCLKADLDLRPIYHKTDDASMAHLHLCILAYWLVATIRYQLKQQWIYNDWREIVRIMSTQKCVTTCVTNIRNEVISVRQCTEPSMAVKNIYDWMNYKYVPFLRKKSVDLPTLISKFLSSNYQIFTDT